MATIDSTYLFADLCNLFEQLILARKIEAKRKLFRTFLSNFRSKSEQLNEPNPSLYNVLRLMLPNEERERGAYNIKEFTFRKTLINILGIHKKGDDATLLGNYKATNNKTINSFPDAVHFVLKKFFKGEGTKMSLKQLNVVLDEVSATANDIRAQEEVILKLFQSTNSLEQKWVVRILLKELRLHFSRDNILKELHQNGVNTFTNIRDLKKTCELLRDPKIFVNYKMQIEPFSAFQPMLSTRCDNNEILKLFKNTSKTYYIEEKFDGERFQLHFNDGQFKYFSRKGFEYSHNFGETFDNSYNFTNKLKDVFKDSVKSIILDGEMMIWYERKKCFGSKGVEIDVKKIKPDNPHYSPCFCVFDMVYLNGEPMADVPLKKRLNKLKEVVTPKPGVIVLSKYTEVNSKEEVIKALNDAMDRDEEGIVFKDVHSIYLPGSRNGWWKMKLEYFKNVMSDLDVIILGGYFGEGKAKNKIFSYLVGVIQPSIETTKYLSFAKIATGLSQNERKNLDDKLKPHWRVVDGKEHEAANIFWGKEAPDVWIEPEKSCCLEVRGSELIKCYGTNPSYRTSHTLRFPRIMKIKLDQPYQDCLTTHDIDKLTTSSGVVTKLNKRHLEVSDLEAPIKKERKVLYDYSFAAVTKRSDILEDKEFLVLTGNGSWTKDDVETAIRENGGTIVRAEASTTFCMLAGDNHLRLKTYKGNIDIVNVEWLRHLLNEGEFIPYTPNDVLYLSPKTKDEFLESYDQYGDSYTEALNLKKLKTLAAKIISKYGARVELDEIKELNKEMKFQDYKIYRGLKAYFDKHERINDEKSEKLPHNIFDKYDFVHKGGEICEELSEECNFVIVGNESRKEAVNEYLKKMNIHVQIIKDLDEIVIKKRKSDVL